MSNEQQVREGRKLVKKLVQEIFNGQPGDWRENYPPASNNDVFRFTLNGKVINVSFPRASLADYKDLKWLNSRKGID